MNASAKRGQAPWVLDMSVLLDPSSTDEAWAEAACRGPLARWMGAIGWVDPVNVEDRVPVVQIMLRTFVAAHGRPAAAWITQNIGRFWEAMESPKLCRGYLTLLAACAAAGRDAPMLDAVGAWVDDREAERPHAAELILWAVDHLESPALHLLALADGSPDVIETLDALALLFEEDHESLEALLWGLEEDMPTYRRAVATLPALLMAGAELNEAMVIVEATGYEGGPAWLSDLVAGGMNLEFLTAALRHWGCPASTKARMDAVREAWDVCREQEWPVEMFQGMLPEIS